MKEADQIVLDLKRRIFKPVYFLCGEETYYIDTLCDYIEHNVLEESEREFNQNVVYGKDIDLSNVLGLARQFPMMGEHNVVIVKEAQNLKELNKSTHGEDDGKSKSNSSNIVQQFLHYIAHPQPTTILVFCFRYKSPDKRSSIVKALQKSAVFIEFKKLYDNQVPEWVVNYTKEKKFSMGPKAAFLISEFLGNDLGKIANELNKLFIGLPAGSEITPERVQDNIGISKDYNVFELQEALAKKDILKANRIINYFAANEKEHPAPMILVTLYGYFSKVLKFHFLADKSKFTAATALGVNPFFVDGYAKAAANYNGAKLKQVFSYLKECDLRTKGVNNSSVSNGELLRELVYKILH